MEEIPKENTIRGIIVLSDLEIIEKDNLTDYFCNKPNNGYYYYRKNDE